MSVPGGRHGKCKGSEAKTRFRSLGLSREASAADYGDKGELEATRMETQVKDRPGRILHVGQKSTSYFI